MADSVEVSTIETTDGTIGIIRDNAARQSIANLREGKETVGSVAWENVKGRPTKVSSFENDKNYQTDENVSNTLNSTLYAGSSTHGGPATSADKLTTARTISLTGAASGSGSFDGSANSSINVQSLDATKLTGVVPITNLPPSVVERMSIVKDDTERFALTTDSVQDGDVVKVQSSGLIYYVVDDDKLSTEAGYEVFKAGTAASVPWGGVTDKPSSYPPSSHTHTKSQITDFPSSLPNPSNLTMQIEGKNAAVYNGGTSQTFNVTKSSLGLDKVTNTADADKSVKSADTADKLTTARNITVGSSSKKFNGSSDVSYSLSEIGAQPSGYYTTLIPTGKALYAGDDLNNISYTAVGTYYCSAIVEAQHISNLPEATAFMMTVYNPLGTLTGPLSSPWQYRVQEFMPYYGTNKYIRMVSTDGKSNVTFNDWVKQTYSNELGAVSNTINTHIANKDNPHGVTKAQVGLGNVDNTADKDKSVKYANSAGSVPWGGVTGKPSTFPPSSHTHTKSQITDFPTSLPASDVSAWAKASSKPSYSWGEITSKPSTFPPSFHTHNTIYLPDTRRENQTPSWYYSNYDKQVIVEFKTSTVIGLSGFPMYCALVTVVPWGDSSGGNVVQRAVDYATNKEYIRSGSGDSWSSWKAVSNKSAKYTLTASKWSGSSAPYTYDLGSTYGNNSVIGFDSAVGSTAQLEAALSANIQGSSTTKIYAYGDKPTVDIPIVIIYQ